MFKHVIKHGIKLLICKFARWFSKPPGIELNLTNICFTDLAKTFNT